MKASPMIADSLRKMARFRPPALRASPALPALAVIFLGIACAIPSLVGPGPRVFLAHAQAGPDHGAGAAGDTKRPHVFVGDEAFPVIEQPMLLPEPGWPVWLKDRVSGVRTEKTSGIAFAGRDAMGRPCFFLADETGFLHFCRVSNEDAYDSVGVRLEAVRFDLTLLEGLRDYQRWDFEEIALEPCLVGNAAGSGADGCLGESRNLLRAGPVADTLDGILSVEGGAEHAAGTLAAVRLIREGTGNESFSSDAETSWKVVSRGDALPRNDFWTAYAGPGRGLKGAASSGRFLFLGLDNLGRRGGLSARGSLLFFFDRQAARVAEVNSASYGIYSIGGMAAVSDRWMIVLDRSRMCITVVEWDASTRAGITQCHRFPLDLFGPGGFRYGIPNLEGVTVDDRGDIRLVCDPEVGHYRVMEPGQPEIVHVYMAAGIPMLYRFSGDPVWQAIGLDGPWGSRPGGNGGNGGSGGNGGNEGGLEDAIPEGE